MIKLGDVKYQKFERWILGFRQRFAEKNGCNERKRQGDLRVGLIVDELLFWAKFEVESYQIW